MNNPTSSRTALLLFAAICLILAIPTGAAFLTFLEIHRNGVDGVLGLSGAWGVAVSRDDRNVYATGSSSNTVAVFSRDGVRGELTFVEMHEDDIGGVDGLDHADSLAVSPDDKNVYVTGGHDDALAVFSRSVVTGRLTFVEVHKDGIGGVDGLDEAHSVAVSADGRNVYVASSEDDAVAVFHRNSDTGILTFAEVHKDGVGPIDGLDRVRSVVVSPDDKNVYAASNYGDAVVVFRRDAVTGVLTFVEAQKDGENGVDGLNGAEWVTVSPDNRHVYVASRIDDAVTVFSRNTTTGALTFVETHKDTSSGIDTLDGAHAVVVSVDNASVFVISDIDDALLVFRRNIATGALIFVEVLVDNIGGVDGLESPFSLAVSADNKNLYVAGNKDDSVAVFGLPAHLPFRIYLPMVMTD